MAIEVIAPGSIDPPQSWVPAKYTSATAIAAIMTKSSLRPALDVVESERSTSLSLFNPSGVSSKAQAKISATGNPSNSSTVTSVAAQSGRLRIGKVVAETSINNHATIA